MTLFSDVVEVAGVRLELLRPESPEALIDEAEFERDEFLPYWAELWPAATALAEALPEVRGLRVVELGCGLGVTSLVAAAKGARVTATDWAPDAIDLLRDNAKRNGLELRAEVRDWRDSWSDRFDVALAADVLYERRNVEPSLARLREVAPVAYVGLAGRPHEREFLRIAAPYVEVAPRVIRLDTLSDGVVTLDAFRETDLDAHLAGEDDEHAQRFGWYPARSTEETVTRALRDWQEQWATGGARRALAARVDGELVGGCELRLDGERAEASYWTFPANRRHGLATRMLELLVGWASNLGIGRIELLIAPDNEGSRRVAARAGFAEVDPAGEETRWAREIDSP